MQGLKEINKNIQAAIKSFSIMAKQALEDVRRYKMVKSAIQEISELKFKKLSHETKFYQTADAMETVCIIEDSDGAISIGVARAGRTDLEAIPCRINSETGMQIAEGRAQKARTMKTPLIEKNYLRGIYLPRIKNT